MGTNYYIHTKPCPHCGHSDETYHLGKSSGGWCFAVHVEAGIDTLAEVMALAREGQIRDEYDESISCEEMMQIITERSSPGENAIPPDFHEENHSEPGPNGLVRYKIDSRCIGHGEGTWDLIVGEFS